MQPSLTSEVRFTRSGLTLLELAESCGLSSNFGCRVGVCPSCEVPLLSGEIRYEEEPAASASKGRVLILFRSAQFLQGGVGYLTSSLCANTSPTAIRSSVHAELTGGDRANAEFPTAGRQ
jgi:2Fe-2S iron-sulfur cluster binding domain